MGIEAAAGISVTMRRYLVWTGGTRRGVGGWLDITGSFKALRQAFIALPWGKDGNSAEGSQVENDLHETVLNALCRSRRRPLPPAAASCRQRAELFHRHVLSQRIAPLRR